MIRDGERVDLQAACIIASSQSLSGRTLSMFSYCPSGKIQSKYRDPGEMLDLKKTKT